VSPSFKTKSHIIFYVRFERKGYKLVAIKVIHPTKEFAAKHYEDLKDKPFFNGLTTYFSSGPVVAMVWEGKGVLLFFIRFYSFPFLPASFSFLID
jgi:nucleoside diphosphate kinase